MAPECQDMLHKALSTSALAIAPHMPMLLQPLVVVAVSDVLHGVSIEEQKAQVVWSRLQDFRQ